MKKIIKYSLCSLVLFASSLTSQAGNPDRAGESGAYELLINGWARSSGLFSMNSANIKGLEATSVNTAGLSFVKKTEVNASYTNWFTGSGIHIINAGIAQNIKKKNVIALTVASFNFGNIQRTTTINPEGGSGTFKPSLLNIGVSYARSFSRSIHAGVTVRLLNQRISDASAMGMAVDAGIEYVAGKRDNIHFGVSIRNLGTNMRFVGDGLTFRGVAPQGTYTQSQSLKGEKFSLPAQLNIGAAYDIYIGKTKESAVKPTDEDEDDVTKEIAKPSNRVTICANFTSNSVGKDHIGLGAEYSFKEMFMLRVAYRYEKGMFKATTQDYTGNTSIFNGLSAGLTFETPLKKEKPARIGFDYSFRMTRIYSGVHTASVRFVL
jgi:opacity protein-like surface antigen